MNKIPKDWEVKKLVEICEIMDNQRKPINSSEREKRLISAKQKFPYYGATGQVGFIDDYIFDCEAVLLGEDGAPFLDFFKDKAYMVSGKFWVNNHAHILKAKNKISLNAFICYFLNTLDYSPYVSGTTRLKLNQSSMKNIEIPLPPLSEQKAIVDKLDDSFAKIENAITNLINAKENLKLYKQSVLKSAFNGDLLPNTSPTHWEVKKLGEICEKIGDGLHGTPSYNDDGEYFFINGRNISYPYLIINNNVKRLSSDEALKYKKDFNTHTIFVSINGTLGNIGFYNNEKIILGKSVCYLNLKDNVNKYYIFFNLKSNEFLNYANLKATGSTIKNVSLQAMRNFEIPLPPLSEQNLIVAEIDRRFAIVDKTLNLIDKSIQNAKNLKQSILKKAFSGELRSEI